MSEDLLVIKDLKKYFSERSGIRSVNWVKAVDGVSFSVPRGATFSVVGESGCGKTTLARTILRLIEPTSGRIILDGQDVVQLDDEELRKMRGKMQIVFQDPMSSLDPRMTVENIVAEPLKVHADAKGKELRQRVINLLESVGLKEQHLHSFPHQLSGGQRQRVGIARAISVDPDFIILDEPTSALDVSVQAQILNLLRDLQRKLKLAYLLISHDLSVVDYLCDRLAVMYVGKIVEIGSRDQIFDNCKHPYTKALLSAIPKIGDGGKEKSERIRLKGRVPSPSDLPEGCNFNTRCPISQKLCEEKEPELVEVEKGHEVACLNIST